MPLIYPPHDPRRVTSRLHKGDGGSGEMRAQEEDRQRKVQTAVDAINAKFGIGGNGGVAPDREQFRRKPVAGLAFGPAGGEVLDVGQGGMAGVTGGAGVAPVSEFDDAAYDEAMASWRAQQGGADAAKTAREALYTDIAGAVRDTALRDLDRQYTDVSRRNTFGLARSGLLGGSVDAEAGGELQTLYGEGRLKAAQAGMQAASDLRTQDEKTRQNLISLAQSGLDTGTAATMAAGQMSAAADLAKSQTAGASVGRIFDDLGQAYLQNQVLKARYPNGLPQQGTSGYSSNLYGPNRYVGNAQG